MKIKYHISQKTEINREIVFKRIGFELDKRGYIIFDVSENCTEFKNKFWLLTTRGEYFGKVDGGKFLISPEKDTKVNFYFYASSWREISLIFFLIISSFIQDYHILFFIPFVLIMFFLRIINVKSTANEIMRNILKETN
ncbi:hypothetical protein SAMN05428975_3121 [Mucilaginibacter sp. OK268]|nr:hypothetical protein SAMN05428975_3121 [Mucilaginibacter sp. OK268]